MTAILKSAPRIPTNHKRKPHPPKHITIFGIKMLNISLADALSLLESKLDSAKPTPIFYANADCLNKIFVDREYYRIMKAASVVFPDGIGINLAGRMLGIPVTENLNGTDMLPYLCDIARMKRSNIFLLGASDGVADKMKEKLLRRYPDLSVCGTHHGYFDWDTEADAIIKQINTAQTDILFVALGAPLQEKFIMKFLSEIKAPLQIGVGGLFDFYSDRIARAPLWMREFRIEWLFRLIQEPRRLWKRYIIGNPLFLYRVFRYGHRALAEIYENED
jgi:N-acetylglucosaminyldiphosphoundecaprenol N-acetyl-beta-D-mannosaminyltransferase